jgi:monovalent cation/proton antiporter MnhG/PhaG subunit
MTARFFDIALLSITVLLCWLGVIGMWRMKEPMQALHYLSLPATAGAIFLMVAVLISQGTGQVFWKVLLITLILLATNSVVTHATARAFRARQLGHWEPLDEDPIETVYEEKKAKRVQR